MWAIVVYDAVPKRGVRLLKYLRRHLTWVQNSVFEGEVTESELEIIKKGIKEIINLQKDSVIYYTFDSQNYHDRGVLGVERNDIDSFV